MSKKFEVSKKWNKFISSLIGAETRWKQLAEARMEMSPEELDSLPIEVQKGLKIFGRQKFGVMIPRFVDHCRFAGGFDTMKTDLSGLKKEDDDGEVIVVEINREEEMANG